MIDLSNEDYNQAAIEVALALAHMNWVSMNADAAANIAALSSSTLDQYTAWEQASIPMKNAALAASYWVARRAMSIVINEFMLDLPSATNLLSEHCRAVPQALRTALQSPDDDRDYGGVVSVLVAAIAARMPHEHETSSLFNAGQMMQ